MPEFRRCHVVGAGAVGSVLAAGLQLHGKAETFLVGRSAHCRRLREKPLTLERAGEPPLEVPIQALEPEGVPPLGPQDLVLLTGKVPDLPSTLAGLKSRIGETTAVIALQNGFGSEELIARELSRGVDRGLLFFGAHSPAPGRVRYAPGRVRLRPSAVTRAFNELLGDSLLRCELAENFRDIEWSKLLINCIANPLAGILKIANRQIAGPELDPAKEAILEEVREVARAEGVHLETTVAELNRYLSTDNIPSLRIDLERGRPTEIDVLNGALVRLGRRHAIPTPANALLVSLIRHLERAAGQVG